MKYNESTQSEVQTQTEDERNGTGEDIATDTAKDLGIDTIILGDAEHVAHRAVDTAANAIVRAPLCL